MKLILVPTDFSTVADNAFKYAIEIAAHFKSELYLYHVYSFSKLNYDYNFSKDEQPYKEEVERRMNLTEQRFLGEITKRELSLQTVVEHGNVFSLFGEKVIRFGFDMIVMGSKGASGLTKAIFGSVAAKALETAQVPVWVIPPNYPFRPFEHIVLALDDKEVSSSTLAPLRKLALQFGAKLTVLNVNIDNSPEVGLETGLELAGLEVAYRKVPMSKSVNESIDDFLREEGCDLLCMVRREKDFFERLFNKSITKAQAFKSHVPLLVLPEHYKNSSIE